jgi:hypothetical protein
VVRRDAACDEIETAVLERQGFRVGARRLHVGEPLGDRELAGLAEHLVGDIAGDHARHMRGECRRGVTGPGGDVERLPVRLGLHQFDEAAEAGALGVDRRRGVGGGVGAELLLDQRFGHGFLPARPAQWRAKGSTGRCEKGHIAGCTAIKPDG